MLLDVKSEKKNQVGFEPTRATTSDCKPHALSLDHQGKTFLYLNSGYLCVCVCVGTENQTDRRHTEWATQGALFVEIVTLL